MARNGLVWVVALVLGVALVLPGCSYFDDDDNGNNDGNGYTLQSVDLDSVELVDANNQLLAGAEVAVVAADETEASVGAAGADDFFPSDIFVDDDAFNEVDPLTADDEGRLEVPPGLLGKGRWHMRTSRGGAASYQMVVIGSGNASASSRFRSSLSCSTFDSCVDQGAEAIIGSLSGVVYDSNGPVAGAQVSLSGGEATNGAYASAITEDDGVYKLTFNVSNNLAEALEASTLRAVAEAYEGSAQTIAVRSGNATGANIELTAIAAGDDGSDGGVLWRETFEDDSGTVTAWEVDGGHTDEGGAGYTGWTLMESGHGAANVLVDTNVKLAPDDQSEGAVPDPAQGNYAYWYGSAVTGNFLGAETSPGQWDGGSGLHHSGTLTSPAIDLSEAAAPISLTFRTWWEIESVNPNENGFDLMSIQISTDGGESFQTIARLNPLSDPASDVERAPLPYSNYGFNAAPGWIQQEPISLDGVAGESDIRLRFEFRTVDGLYNGFRGWLVDDVVIQEGEGTFPLWGGLDWDNGYGEEELCTEYPEYYNEDDSYYSSAAQAAAAGTTATVTTPDGRSVFVVPSRRR